MSSAHAATATRATSSTQTQLVSLERQSASAIRMSKNIISGISIL
ncbi:MAG: hypothetical protein WAW59_07625 [Patescibacteria group bacterium]